jgi:O-succinylbenzoic acid--CoA ligase
MGKSWRDLIKINDTSAPLNPTLSAELQALAHHLITAHPNPHPMMWILSSGTSSTHQNSFKFMGLTQEALLASAKAVNLHLNATSDDRWLNVLPLFHVGGLGILYRAYVSESECFNIWDDTFKWNPHHYRELCQSHNITLSSLVPTQIYDLVQAQLVAPASLRAIVVGGARLNEELYQKARHLGWPLLPSFGMTEAGSQVATASLASLGSTNYPELQLLSHISARTNEHHQLSLRGSSLFEGFYAIQDGVPSPWCNPKDAEGWYLTQDCAHLNDGHLQILARVDDVIKIRGENVNLSVLRNRLEQLQPIAPGKIDCTIVAIPESRLGHQLVIVGNAPLETLQALQNRFNQQSLPFERIEQSLGPIELPRTALGKIQNQKLIARILAGRTL